MFVDNILSTLYKTYDEHLIETNFQKFLEDFLSLLVKHTRSDFGIMAERPVSCKKLKKKVLM